MRSVPAFRIHTPAIAALLGLALAAPALASCPCRVPDNAGTAVFPPECNQGYLTRGNALLIQNGLAPGDFIRGRMRLYAINVGSDVPGGGLGGRRQQWTAVLQLDLEGTGSLAGYLRQISVPLQGTTDTAPIVPGASPQSFATDLYELLGQIPPGDPDFDLLRITAGTNFGLPSPGHTILTRLPDGGWAVDSFFDVFYRIDFVGAPGGPLAGMSGSTSARDRLREGVPEPALCVEPDNGAGTANFPTACLAGYSSAPDVPIAAGLLANETGLFGSIRLRNFHVTSVTPGGSLGGDQQQFTVDVELVMLSLGSITGYQRTITIPCVGETHTAPNPPAPEQPFQCELFRLQGQVTGDPDFDLLRITAGTGYGLPSPGHTVFTGVAAGGWWTDSFFDITYRIDFVGAPGGMLAGYSGSTNSQQRHVQGDLWRTACVVPDNGSGTADFPPACLPGYRSSYGALVAVDGLPLGTTLESRMTLESFSINSTGPAGCLNDVQTWDALMWFEIYGTGTLTGYARTLVAPVQGRTCTGPIVPYAPLQSFPTDLYEMIGQVPPGDPDFDLLRITAGTNFSLPGPGHAILVDQGGGNWALDSFFDVTYRIDFIGAPGGPLAGMSGSTTHRECFVVGRPRDFLVAVEPLPAFLSAGRVSPNPSRDLSRLDFELPAPRHVKVVVYDLAGRLVRELADGIYPAGRHAATWDGRDAAGRAMGPGIYFYRARLGAEQFSRLAVRLE